MVLADGAIQEVPRRAGTATVHNNKVLHAVAATKANATRYSLVLFHDMPDGAADDKAVDQARKSAAARVRLTV